MKFSERLVSHRDFFYIYKHDILKFNQCYADKQSSTAMEKHKTGFFFDLIRHLSNRE